MNDFRRSSLPTWPVVRALRLSLQNSIPPSSLPRRQRKSGRRSSLRRSVSRKRKLARLRLRRTVRLRASVL